MKIQKPQKLIRPDIGRVCGNCFLKLYDCKIFPVLGSVLQALVISFYCLIDTSKLPWYLLHLTDVIIGNIIMGLEILADNPFHKCFHHVAPAIIYKTQKIHGRHICPVVLQAAPE